MFRAHVLPWLAWWLYRLWTSTWRVTLIESPGLVAAKERGEPLIFAHWHGSELAILPLVKPYRIATMTSTSKDGQLIDYTVRRLGGATSRGSSTRGGVSALTGLVRLVVAGYRASMDVDGPKGPLHVVKPGVFELSRLAKAKIVPMGAAANHALVFHKAWNKAFLPKPFAHVVVYFAEPWPAVARHQSAKNASLQDRLQAEIAKACVSATERLT